MESYESQKRKNRKGIAFLAILFVIIPVYSFLAGHWGTYAELYTEVWEVNRKLPNKIGRMQLDSMIVVQNVIQYHYNVEPDTVGMEKLILPNLDYPVGNTPKLMWVGMMKRVKQETFIYNTNGQLLLHLSTKRDLRRWREQAINH